MNSHLKGICPLCGNYFLRIELHAHIQSEHPSIRQETINEIKARRPDWVYEFGACQNCWELHRALSQSPRSAAISTPEQRR